MRILRRIGPFFLMITSLAIAAAFVVAQEQPLDGREGRQLLLENFRPQSQLRVPFTKLSGARFPAIDIHTHFRIRTKHSPEQLDAFVQENAYAPPLSLAVVAGVV